MNQITQESFNKILEKQSSEEGKITIADYFFDSEIIFPSELKDIIFRNCKFTKPNFEGTAFIDVVFESCVLAGGRYEKINANYVDFVFCNMSFSHFEDSTLSNISFRYSYAISSSFINTSARYFTVYCTNFSSSNFNYCSFCDYTFVDSDMTDCKVIESTLHLPQFIPSSGSFIGWKKALTADSLGEQHEVIVKLRIPENAERVCASHKCRASEVEVLGFETLEGEKLPDNTNVFSWWNSYYRYKIGIAKPMYEFDHNPQVECGSGIHFFLDREAAVNYRF